MGRSPKPIAAEPTAAFEATPTFRIISNQLAASITAYRSEESGYSYNIGETAAHEFHRISELWSSRITSRPAHVGYLQLFGRPRTVEVHLYADIA